MAEEDMGEEVREWGWEDMAEGMGGGGAGGAEMRRNGEGIIV